MSDSFIMFYSFIVFYSFIRRRWINSFLTFDNFFAISFFMSHSRLHYLNTLHSLLSPQTIVNEKRAPSITVDTLPLVPAGTNLILLN